MPIQVQIILMSAQFKQLDTIHGLSNLLNQTLASFCQVPSLELNEN
jgi:hypothetical protein